MYEEVLALDSKRAAVYIRLGVIELEHGGFPVAIERLSKAVEIAPDHADAYLQRAQVS